MRSTSEVARSASPKMPGPRKKKKLMTDANACHTDLVALKVCMSHRPFEPKMTDPPETMVICQGGPHDKKLIKARMLSNLSGGKYRKDPACTWINPKNERGYPLYRWVASDKSK